MIPSTPDSKVANFPSRLLGYGYPVLIIIFCSAFLIYKYVLQIYPSIITHQLMQEFQLNGVGLGYLAGMYYYVYIFTQLFAGVLLDKYSARWLTAAAIFGCALGIFLFAHSYTLMDAILSRGLMGVGVAFATVAYMKLAAEWFPPRHYAFVGGLLATACMAGALFGQAPLSIFIGAFGWRQCLAIIGIVGFIFSALFALCVRDRSISVLHPQHHKMSSISKQDIIAVVCNKHNWLLTFYCGLAFAPLAVFGGLWGNPFLQEAHQLTTTEAASMISFSFFGWAIGSPVLGFLSDRLGERRYVMFYSTLLACATFSTVLYWTAAPLWLVGILLFIFGFSLGAFMLVFTIGKELNLAKHTAMAIAMINTGDLLIGLSEPLIGKLLDLTWDGKVVKGVHYFSLHSYHLALSILPLYLIISALLVLGVRKH